MATAHPRENRPRGGRRLLCASLGGASSRLTSAQNVDGQHEHAVGQDRRDTNRAGRGGGGEPSDEQGAAERTGGAHPGAADPAAARLSFRSTKVMKSPTFCASASSELSNRTSNSSSLATTSMTWARESQPSTSPAVVVSVSSTGRPRTSSKTLDKVHRMSWRLNVSRLA